MARQQFVGVGRVWWVSTISSTAAPTVAEITAGTDLTPYLRRDGLKRPQSANTVDSSDASSLFNKQAVGTFGGDMWEATLLRDSTTTSDLYLTALTAPTAAGVITSGYVVVRDFGGSGTAVATSQKVTVAAVDIANKFKNDPAENEPQTFTVQFAVTSPPVDGTVS